MNSIEVPSNGQSRNGHSNGKFNTSPNGSPFNNNFMKQYNNDSNDTEEL